MRRLLGRRPLWNEEPEEAMEKRKIRAAIAGACGRMGQRIVHAVLDTPSLVLTGALEIPGHEATGKDVGLLVGRGEVGVRICTDLQEVMEGSDVLIDFTNPEASLVHLKKAVELKKAIVIGTTGFDRDQMTEIQRIAPSTRCVLSPNMSVGVNVVLVLLDVASRALGEDYDVEVVEVHHKNKVDTPSGTALKMAEVLASSTGRRLEEAAVFARMGQVGPRKRGEIGIQSVRGGDIVGEHTVLFAGLGERIEITHRAHSRDNFARGAVRAALWVVDRPPGLYDMQDVLGLRR